MPFSITWNESYPSGSDLMSGLDTYIQQDKIATRERLESLLGISDFSSRYPMSADLLNMGGTTTSGIIGGSVGFGILNNANTQVNLAVADNGDTYVRGNFTVPNGNLIVSTGTTTTKNLDVSAAQARCVEYDNGNCTGATAINLNNGNNQLLTLTGAVTVTFSNPIVGTWYQFRLVQDGTGSRTVTWPATVKWQGGIAPTLTTTASRTDMIAMFYNGTNYIAMVVGYNWSA